MDGITMTRDDIERMVKAGEVDQLWTLFDVLKDQRDRAEATIRAHLQHIADLRATSGVPPVINKAKAVAATKAPGWKDVEAALAENLAARKEMEL